MSKEVIKASTGMSLSIWFFMGILMLAYGLVLTVTGVYEFWHPPSTVLAELHPTFWWGLLMTVFGGFYTVRFWPRGVHSR